MSIRFKATEIGRALAGAGRSSYVVVVEATPAGVESGKLDLWFWSGAGFSQEYPMAELFRSADKAVERAQQIGRSVERDEYDEDWGAVHKIIVYKDYGLDSQSVAWQA